MSSVSPIKRPAGAALRLPLVVLNVFLLVVAVLTGLQRMGWAIAWPPAQFAAYHGPLMSVMFFGALIALERAVALGRWPFYAAPVLMAAAGIVWLAGAPLPVVQGLAVAGGVAFAGVAVAMVRTHRALYTETMGLGIIAFAIGTVLWGLGHPMSRVIWWWVAFFVFTIAGERLELGRLTGAAQRYGQRFRWGLGLSLGGLLLAEAWPAVGVRLYALGLLSLGLWLLQYDIARFTIRQPGLPRFAATCLLSGYFWLILGAAVVLIAGFVQGGLLYDAALHAVMIGFVFAMVFGHAPIIFPALLGLPIRFHPLLYAPLLLLHGSLAWRFLADLLQSPAGRRWGGMFNAISIALYFTIMALVRLVDVLRARRTTGAAGPR